MHALDVQTRTFGMSNCIFLAQEFNEKKSHKKHKTPLFSRDFQIYYQVLVNYWGLLTQYRLRRKRP